jgi:MFS superfamily sulfate permease-like transporter
LFGIEKEEGDFFEQLWGVITHLGDTHGRTLLVGVSSLAIVLGLRRFAPAVPGSLVAVAFGVLVVKLFDLADKGVDIVGDIASGLPSIGLPDCGGIDDYLATVSAAGGIMLVGFAEGLGAAKTYAARDHHEIDNNRELARSRRGQPGQRIVLRHGRQRQPLQDGSQWIRRRPFARPVSW